LIKFAQSSFNGEPVGSKTLVRLAAKEHRARVTKLVLACTIVPTFRDVPLANIDDAIERHLGGDDQYSHRVTSPSFGRNVDSRFLEMRPPS
jgi:hypothetical protein